MNVLTGGWCRFVGWNANCFELFNDDLYFGDNLGVVQLAYSGSADLTSPIVADMQCAFNWFEEPGRLKRMTMIQPLLTMGGAITPTLAVDVDFATSNVIAPVSTFMGSVLWGVARWDLDVWPDLTINYIQFLSVEALAIRMRVNVTGAFTYDGIFDYSTFDHGAFDGGLSTDLPVLQVNAFNAILEFGGAI